MTEDEKQRLNELMVDLDEYDTNKNRQAIAAFKEVLKIDPTYKEAEKQINNILKMK